MTTASGDKVPSRFANPTLLSNTLYGKVYRAVDQVTGADVAVKVAPRDRVRRRVSATGTALLEDMDREAAIMRLLGVSGDCRNALTLTADGVDDATSSRYIAMPFCDRGDLFRLIETEGPLSEAKARMLFADVVRGTETLHKLGHIHRDISLENVFLRTKQDGNNEDEQEAVLADFGLARPIGYRGQAHRRAGKLGYMAPEMYTDLESGVVTTEALDVWSLGIVLFIMLTGLPPYATPARSDPRFAFIARGKVRKLLSAWKFGHLSEDCQDLLEACLVVDAEHRATLADVLQHPFLANLLAEETAENEPHEKNDSDGLSESFASEAEDQGHDCDDDADGVHGCDSEDDGEEEFWTRLREIEVYDYGG